MKIWVCLEREEKASVRWWIASIEGTAIHTQGRDIPQALKRLSEASALLEGDDIQSAAAYAADLMIHQSNE